MKANLKSQPIVVLPEDASLIVLAELAVRSLHPEEQPRAAQLLDAEHYLGAARPVGHTLTQVVHHHGRWVALLVWGPAALKLADREAWLGWSDAQRAERLGLLVQNRRFLVLSATRQPNLASRALALAVQALPAAWAAAHGYRPLLAETFTDLEAFEGTCYKAAGWVPVGKTRGFARHRADFYQRHDRPKKLWLKPLQRNARVLLGAMDLPKAYAAGLQRQSAERPLPLQAAQLDSLEDALRRVPDPRGENRVFSCGALLMLVALALLAGRKHLAEIQRYGQFLTQAQRARLGFPFKKGTRFRKAPSYSALYNLLTQLDPHGFAQALNAWLAAHHGTLPRALALDGKYVRDCVLTLCLSEHDTGAPAAVALAAPAPCTPEAKAEGELTAARRLYPQTELQGALVTADALHCEPETMRLIVEGGGDYLLQLKANQPTALARAQAVAASATPLLPTTL
jgi:hypothetical protein